MNEREEINLSIFSADTSQHVELPMSGSGISAGFPSPADDYMDLKLDLNRELVRHPEATFFARVSGYSMSDAGIDDGDILVIDRSVEPYDGCTAVCFVDGEFTLKKVKFEKDHILLVPASERYKPIKVTADNELVIWGVVRYVIKKI